MARKRMISPSMWESDSFSELNDLAKLVFISMISHADDEGRGKASPAYIRSVTFPNDENRRVADISQALSDIGREMSVQFYSVDGKRYYYLTNWTEYQKIDKPTKSKLPPPPNAGVGGDIPTSGQFGEGSGSIRGIVDEGSSPKTNIIQDNDVNQEYNSYLLRTRKDWTDIVDKQCGLEIARECCISAFGNDEVYNLVLNTLLDVLVSGKDITVGEKVYRYGEIAHAVESMERNVFADIEGAFCKIDGDKIMKKQISNPANYIVTILMAKHEQENGTKWLR